MEGTVAKRLKLLYLMKIFSENTDDEHGLTLSEITAGLEKYDISADRKTLYSDFQALTDYGFEILSDQRGGKFLYYLSSRLFELSELKLLVDAVQSAKFISEKRSAQLIKKLESLVSRHEARDLHRQVFISGRVKTMNESVYYAVDAIQSAINRNVKLRFRYYNWNVKKQMEFRKGGAYYEISPWALVWDDEYYYMIGFDAESRTIKHYRVDKMTSLTVTDKKREGEAAYNTHDIRQYSKSLFRMYGGEMTDVTLRSENRLSGVIIDQFGKDVMMIPEDDAHFHVIVRVALSNQFLSWVTALDGGVTIIGPDTAVEKMREMLRKQMSLYAPGCEAIEK